MPSSTQISTPELDQRLEAATKRLEAAGSVSDLLQEVLDIAIKTAGADLGTMQRYDSVDDCLKIVAARGFPDATLNRFAIVRPYTNSTCAVALMQRMRVVVNDIASSYIFFGTNELIFLQQAGVAAVHSTPLIASSGRLWGVLSICFHEPRANSAYDPLPLDRLAVRMGDWLEALETRLSKRDRQQRPDRAAGSGMARDRISPGRPSLQTKQCGMKGHQT